MIFGRVAIKTHFPPLFFISQTATNEKLAHFIISGFRQNFCAIKFAGSRLPFRKALKEINITEMRQLRNGSTQSVHKIENA